MVVFSFVCCLSLWEGLWCGVLWLTRTGGLGAGVRLDFVLLGKCLLHIGQSNGGFLAIGL